MRYNTAEKFLLLAHHPEKGRFILQDIQLNYGLIGAILMDMSLDNHISVENGNIHVNNTARSDSKTVSEIKAVIASSDKPRKIKHWISKLARRSRHYKWSVLSEMSDKKIIRIEDRKLLGIFPYKKSFLNESMTRYNLIQQVKSSIFFQKEMSNETVAILGMIEACKMYRVISKEREEIRTMKKTLKRIVKESPIADSLGKTISEVQAAVMSAVIAASIASTAGHSS